MRHILKVWGIGGEEQREYSRLLHELLRVRSAFVDIGKMDPDSCAYRSPCRRYTCEARHLGTIEALFTYLVDELNTLRTFGWRDEEIARFPQLVQVVDWHYAVSGAEMSEALHVHERLLRGIAKKRRLFDLERKLRVANQRATGIWSD